jgi:hypothetical protein
MGAGRSVSRKLSKSWARRTYPAPGGIETNISLKLTERKSSKKKEAKTTSFYALRSEHRL